MLTYDPVNAKMISENYSDWDEQDGNEFKIIRVFLLQEVGHSDTGSQHQKENVQVKDQQY